MAPTELGTAPFGSCWSLASLPGNPDLVLAGAGSALLVLDAEASFQRVLDAQAVPLDLRPGGMVFDVELAGNLVYAAAGSRGVAAYERSTWQPATHALLALPNPTPYERVVSIEVVHFADGHDLVFVGTDENDIDGQACVDQGLPPLNPECNDGQRDGRLLLYDTSRPVGLELVDQVDTGRAVFALAVRPELYAGKVTALIATACGQVRVFQVANSAPSLGPGTQVGPALTSIFPRDLLFHTNSLGATRVYLAAYDKGVLGFNVSGASSAQFQLAQIASPGWPLQPAPGTVLEPNYCVSLALDGTNFGRLAVGLTGPFNEERQFSPGCPTAALCNGVTTAEGGLKQGIALYELNDFGVQPLPLLTVDENGFIPFSGAPHKFRGVGLNIRSSTSNAITLDVASQGSGLVELNLLKQGAGQWQLDTSDWWDGDDNHPVSTNDTLLYQDGTLYSGTELRIVPHEAGLVAMGLSADSLGASVGVTGFPEPEARVIGIGTTGFSISNTSGVYRLAPTASTLRKEAGNVRLGKAMFGLQNGALVSPPPRWLVLATLNELRTGMADTPYGTLQVWDVGYEVDAASAAVKKLGSFKWVQAGCTDCAMKFYDVEVRPISISAAYLYATAMFIEAVPQPPPAQPLLQFKPGLVRVRMDMVVPPHPPGQTPAPELQFSDAQFTPLGTEVFSAGFQVWRLHFDADSGRIYAAFACKGAAVFSDPNPTVGVAPVLVERRELVAGSAFEVLPGPCNSLYVSLMEAGVGVLRDADHIATCQFDVHPTRFSALGLVVDPTDPSRRSLYVADTEAGVVYYEFSESLLPCGGGGQ